MRRAFDAVGAAFAYFSIAPVGRFARGARPDGAALAALPLVGATLGVAAALGARGALAAGATPGLAGALAFAVEVVGSGAIHLDGFLDCCDAIFAPVPPERRREILKDPRHGSFALAGMAVVAAVRCAAIAHVAARNRAALPSILVLAGVSSRLAAVTAAALFPYGVPPEREPGGAARPPAVPLVGIGAVLAVASLGRGRASAGVVATAFGGGMLAARSAARAFGGGLSGDAYGFVAVVVELATVGGLALAER